MDMTVSEEIVEILANFDVFIRWTSGKGHSSFNPWRAGNHGSRLAGKGRKQAKARGWRLCFILKKTQLIVFLQLIMGRQKLKKSFQYEVKWRGLDHRYNTWVARDDLINKGFSKIVQQFDDLESSREGAGSRDTAAHLVRKHLEDIGLDGDIAQYNEISGLSGGELTKYSI